MCHRTTLFSLSDESRAIRWPPVSRKWYLSRHWINPSWLWSWTLNSLQMRHNFLLFIVTWFMVSCYSCLNGFQQCSVEGNFGLVDRCVLHVYTATRDNIIWLLRARQTFLVLYSWFLSLWIRMTWQGFENQDFWLYTSTRKINTSSLDFYDFFPGDFYKPMAPALMLEFAKHFLSFVLKNNHVEKVATICNRFLRDLLLGRLNFCWIQCWVKDNSPGNNTQHNHSLTSDSGETRC